MLWWPLMWVAPASSTTWDSDLDTGTWIILSAAALFALNRTVFLGPPWARWFPRFWLIQALNLGMTCYLILAGIPDFRGGLHIISLVLAGLFVFHSVKNNRRFEVERRQLGSMEESDLDERRKAIHALIREDGEE